MDHFGLDLRLLPLPLSLRFLLMPLSLLLLLLLLLPVDHRQRGLHVLRLDVDGRSWLYRQGSSLDRGACPSGFT